MVVGSREEKVNIFLFSVDKSSTTSVKKVTLPLLHVSFTMLLVTSSRLHGAARAGASCSRSCIGVVSRSSRIHTLDFGSGLCYGKVLNFAKV